MLDFDLNCIPDVESPVLSPHEEPPVLSSNQEPEVLLPQDACVKENNERQPIAELTEKAREHLIPAEPGETSAKPPRKKRGCPKSHELPVGWVVVEHVRTEGQTAGRRDKYYYEPGTGTKFRSMAAVLRRIDDMKSGNNKC